MKKGERKTTFFYLRNLYNYESDNFFRVSVSRAVKPLVEDARPPDYFSQKACNYIVYATSPSESSVLMGEVHVCTLYCAAPCRTAHCSIL